MVATSLLLFFRPRGDSEVERLVDAARVATLRDTVHRAARGGFDSVIIATTTPESFADLPGVEIDVDGAEMPFAARFLDVLRRHEPPAICYAGAGLPLMTSSHWAAIHERLSSGEATLTNNLYSSDLLATTEVSALSGLPPTTPDNGLALFLRDQAGLEPEVLPRSAATWLDIDTPTELVLLSLGAGVERMEIGPELSALLLSTKLDTSKLEQALSRFTERETTVLVVGRVGSAVWQALERETASRVRVISEERGMRASQRRELRSILGYHAAAVGPEALVDALGELADAVFMDTRPLLGHLGWDASRADRFHSDRLDWQAIQHPDLQAFTRAVAASRAPIVLGGHALVSGGLLAAIDIAWARWESSR